MLAAAELPSSLEPVQALRRQIEQTERIEDDLAMVSASVLKLQCVYSSVKVLDLLSYDLAFVRRAVTADVL